MQTIEEAKQYLRDNYKKGVICPVCTQTVRLWKWKMNSEMAFYLIKLNNLCKKEERFYHIKEIYSEDNYSGHFSGGHFAKLAHWDLIEEMEKDPERTEKRTSGKWIITQKGKDFAENRINVFERVKLFNQKRYGYEGKEITIQQALGNKFNYTELKNTF